MKGTSNATHMQTTSELERGEVVTLDHTEWEVLGFKDIKDGLLVLLAGFVSGKEGNVFIHKDDMDYVMWEMASV